MTTHVRSVPVADLELAAAGVGDGRTVTVRVVSWDTPYRVTDDGAKFFQEQFAPGGLVPKQGGPVTATVHHNPDLLWPGTRVKGASLSDRHGLEVGRVQTFRSERDGLYADIRIDEGDEGDALLAKIAAGDVGVSSEFDDDYVDPLPGQLITRTRAELFGLAFTYNPQHSDARVLAVREDVTPTPERPDMSDTPTPPPPVDDPPAPVVPPVPNDDSRAQHVRSDVRQAPVPGAPGLRVPSFRSFAEFVQAVADPNGNVSDEVREAHYRAIDVAGTGDMAGLIQVQWAGDVIDIYRSMTPTVQAFSRGTLPDKGLTVSQPIVAVRPTIAVQTPGAEIESTKATITTASWTVQTAAGGQGTTIQAILRSDPSYLDTLMRLYVEEMAKFLNLTVATGLYAAADDVNTTDLEYTTADVFDELIIDGSAIFLDSIGRPAEVLGMSVDLWKAVAKAKDDAGAPLYPSINPMNRHGSMSARSTSGQVVAVDWYVDPAFGGVGDGITGVLGVREAYKTLLGQVGTMTADVPSTLVRDTAVFQFFAHGKVDATGLIQIANAA